MGYPPRSLALALQFIPKYHKTAQFCEHFLTGIYSMNPHKNY